MPKPKKYILPKEEIEKIEEIVEQIPYKPVPELPKVLGVLCPTCSFEGAYFCYDVDEKVKMYMCSKCANMFSV